MMTLFSAVFFFFQAEDGIRDLVRSRGLGDVYKRQTENAYMAYASEGGHTDFGPNDDTQVELLRYMLKRYGHAGYERILSLIHI